MPLQVWFEALMLFCFSIGWYWSIGRMLYTGRPYGKSLGFVTLTCFGYVFGLTAKLIDWQQGGALSHLVYLYTWNLCVTSFDLLLLQHLTRREMLAIAPHARIPDI